MRAPEIDRVRAAHDRMIGTDPNRDASVITFVSRSEPRACRLVEQPQHHTRFDRDTEDDHALGRKPVTQRAGDKCSTSPARSRRQGRSPPTGGSSSAQSLDAGEHRTTLPPATAGMAHFEHVSVVSSASSSCGNTEDFEIHEEGVVKCRIPLKPKDRLIPRPLPKGCGRKRRERAWRVSRRSSC